jgi:ligand-binding sensor domain-containing protein/signal transduction histidine kinase
MCPTASPFKLSARRLSLLLPLLVFCGARTHALDPRRELTQFSRQTWQTENGLPQNTVRSVIQAREGYIWVATEEGLARFDGDGFVVLDKQNTPQFKSNDVRSLLQDRRGALWVGTAAGLVRIDGGEVTSFGTQQGLPGDDIESLYEDRDGVVWVGTSSGLSRYADGAFTNFTTREGLPANGVQTLFEDAEGVLWVGTTVGAARFRGGRFESFDAGGAGASVEAVEQGADGCLWLGTSDGLACYKEGRLKTYTVADGLPNDRVTTLRADAEGSLWVGTAAGLSRFRDGRFENFTGVEGLSDGVILSLFEDAEGSLWVGTESGGLSQLKDKKFTTYTTKEGLSSDLVKAIYEDRRGRVWVGTYGGGLNLLQDGKVSVYTTKQGLASNIVLALADDAAGDLWAGTPDGLSRLRDGRFETYTSADGLPNDFVRSLYAARDGSLWVGTRGGLARLKDGVFETYTTREGLPDDFVGTINEDAEGNLWVGTLGGLSKLAGGKFENYTTREGLSDDVVISIHGDAEGRMWVGTNGGGLNLLKGGRFTAFTTRDGLPDDVIYRVLEDGRGRLWMSCNKGIFRLAKSELDDFAAGRVHSLSPVLYGTADGMATRECSGGGHPSAWRDHEGRLWFSTIKGVAMIDPERVASNTHPPPVAIEQVRVDGEPVAAGTGVEFAPGKSRFDFYYAGLSFVAPGKVRYKYKLEGFDRDWVDGGDRRAAYYTNLGPGDYRFLVLACNNDGVWSSAPASFAFRLRPHFYRTYWFYALCALGLGLLAWQLYALRLRQVRARFAAVLRERNRIAREIHDNLAQEILGVSVQLEIVSRLLPAPDGAARAHLDRARALVRSSIAEARRYVWDLRSQSLEDRDLPTALSEMTRRLTAGSGVQTQFGVSGTFRPLAPQVENNLLRIGQEAVNNAVRHARARTINVHLSYDAERAQLSVKDDGEGFDASAEGNGSGGHFGILGMRERAEEMGGSVVINSSPGAGSEVLVSVPIEA